MGRIDEDALARRLEADPDSTLALLADMTTATDEVLRARAHRLAARLVLARCRTNRITAGGTGRPRPVPADRGGDLDLDASFEAIAGARGEGRVPHLGELTARDWGRPELALCLLVDDSGSMTGPRLAAAAMLTAACALKAPVEHAVSAFSRDVRPIRRLTEAEPAETVVTRVLGLRGHGVTGLAGALRHGADVLAAARATRRVVVLLSDCRATDEEDPLPAAAAVDELVVIAPKDDGDAARELAEAVGARWTTLHDLSSAVVTLGDLLR